MKQNNQLTDSVRQEIKAWFEREEAASDLQEAAEEADREIARLREASRLTWKQMNTPIGPLRKSN
ncbi:hypothetical protein D3C84_1243910 [compost metagenome]